MTDGKEWEGKVVTLVDLYGGGIFMCTGVFVHYDRPAAWLRPPDSVDGGLNWAPVSALRLSTSEEIAKFVSRRLSR